MNALFMESLYFGKSGGNNMNQTLYIQTDRNVKAVSYTHLDVYKRQVWALQLDWGAYFK